MGFEAVTINDYVAQLRAMPSAFGAAAKVGATEYISVTGSKDYLDNSKAFDAIDIPVKYFNFTQPKYQQLFDGFIENMSVIDLLMNCGEKSLDLIRTESSISK